MEIQAGWYPDESMPGFDRYWDGSWWTPQTRESVTSGRTPPTPPQSPNPSAVIPVEESSTEAEEFLDMSRIEFEEEVCDLADRARTYPALLLLHEVEAEALVRARRIMKDHMANAGRAVIRPQIQALVTWHQEQCFPAMQALGTAIQADFDEILEMIGGQVFLTVPVDQAWDNYTAPIRSVTDEFASLSKPMQSAVGDIEDEYLFA